MATPVDAGDPGSDAKPAVNPLADIEAPLAEIPSPPVKTCLEDLINGTSFVEQREELEQIQNAGKQLQENVRLGTQLVHNLTARLQRGDSEGASQVLSKIQALPSPQVSLGESFWNDQELRHRLCEYAGVGHFMELYLGSLGFMSFLHSGVLTPVMPEAWKVGPEDQDDERYLIGVLGACRELERYAVNRGQALDLKSIRLCLQVCTCLEQVLMQFDFRNGDLRRRFDGVKYTVKRLENLAYEVDLAHQRAEAAGQRVTTSSEEIGATHPDAATVLDIQSLGRIKERYDRFDGMREEVLKRARDVIKGAKNAVYALQRSDFRKADADLEQCAKLANDIHKELVGSSPTLRGGLFSASLEEMAEALAYRAFRQEKKLLGRSELQSASGLSFKLAVHEYLGALMDLTGEVGRLAIRHASRGREAVPDVQLCLACVDAVYSGLQELPYLPAGLGKKLGPLKGTLGKIEGTLYELALLSQGGLRVKAPAMEEERGDADGGYGTEDAKSDGGDGGPAPKRFNGGGKSSKKGKGKGK
eukprot:TRINITY_DN29265_c0_g1_i1.p1 TRINITY_DN29265_c0_g1~~TRINITY_DN29265_c0_g1_i1.p1  ORF type:complete len:557 (+),score=89.03 TRINITY_DN29265_c0_g1_i1:79-1671(+)